MVFSAWPGTAVLLLVELGPCGEIRFVDRWSSLWRALFSIKMVFYWDLWVVFGGFHGVLSFVWKCLMVLWRVARSLFCGVSRRFLMVVLFSKWFWMSWWSHSNIFGLWNCVLVVGLLSWLYGDITSVRYTSPLDYLYRKWKNGTSTTTNSIILYL